MNDWTHAETETIRAFARLVAKTAGAWTGHLGWANVDRARLGLLGEALGAAIRDEIATLEQGYVADNADAGREVIPHPTVIAEIAIAQMRARLLAGVRRGR